ncbi:MAG: hypothetical protein WD066_05965 [Planctomycetaceae bacterium]
MKLLAFERTGMVLAVLAGVGLFAASTPTEAEAGRRGHDRGRSSIRHHGHHHHHGFHRGHHNHGFRHGHHHGFRHGHHHGFHHGHHGAYRPYFQQPYYGRSWGYHRPGFSIRYRW